MQDKCQIVRYLKNMCDDLTIVKTKEEIEMRIDDIESAYKKLKASVYNDKTLAILRHRIVKYEAVNEYDLTERFEAMLGSLAGDDEDWDVYKDEQLDSIKILYYPKSVSDKVDDEDNSIILNLSSPELKVEKINNFIDMNVECPTADCGRRQPHFKFGKNASPTAQFSR